MTRDRLVSVFVILAAVAVALVVVWLAAFRKPSTVSGPTTVLVAPPVTPLPRDSGPKNNTRRAARKGSLGSVGPKTRKTAQPLRKSIKPAKPVKTPKTRPTPRPKAKPHNGSQSGSQPSPSASPAPAPHRPPAVLEVNPPAGPTVCNPVVSIRCPTSP